MSKKGVPNTAPKTEAPPTRKKDPMVRPGRSLAAPLASALFRQETVVRAAVEAQFEILVKKRGLGSNSVEKKLNRCKKCTVSLEVVDCKADIETESVEAIVETNVQARDLTRPGQRPGEFCGGNFLKRSLGKDPLEAYIFIF